MRLLGRIILIVLAVIGGLTLTLTGAGLYAALRERPAPLPKQMVLMLDLNRGIAEVGSSNPFFKLEGKDPLILKDVVALLDRAANDPQVVGVAARIDGVRLGLAQAQEIRDAVATFRKSGKKTAVFSTSLGEFSAATGAYYTASAFQDIWMQPSGDIGLTGFMAEAPFIRDTLDMLGIKAEFGARHEYKSAIDTFTQRQFTKENREATQMLISAFSRQVTEGIAQDRKLTVDQVKALIDRAPLLGAEAKDAKLVDHLAYWDEFEKAMTDGGAKLVDVDAYAARSAAKPAAADFQVALIYGVGTVQQGDKGAFSEDTVMASERITKAFRDAVKDPKIKAILFRIDSPGGSYTASDAIWREVVNARAAGKPVVVSMGNVAASGGYFAAMAADKVIAQPGTITGSIGVFSGKIVLADLWKKLGVNWDEIHEGRNAPMWSSNQPFNADGWERMNAMLDHVYADFTGKAKAARKLSDEQIDKVARGRVWPGDEARKVGLVDENGGFATAFVALRQLAHQPAQMPVDLQVFPKPKDPLEMVVDMLGNGGHGGLDSQTRLRLARLMTVLEPALSVLESGTQPLMMPPLEVK